MPLILKSVDPARGARWVGDAFRLFARRPLGFTLMFVFFLLAVALLGVVPLLGGVLQLMALPLLSLGFMIAGQSALLDGPVQPGQFIAPLRGSADKRRQLLLLCAIYAIAAIGILVLCDAVSDGALRRFQELMAKGDAPPSEMDAILNEPGVVWAALIALVLGTALSVPFWHAPALVHWGDQGAGQALFSSTLAVWRNKGAFFVYGLAWLGLMMLAGIVSALLFGLLGLRQLAGLAAMPVALMLSTAFYVSLLFTFNDSFGGAQSAPAETT